MSQHEATVTWQPQGEAFTYEAYSRNHEIRFANDATIEGSAAVDYKGDLSRVDPEAMFVASLSSCHMLTFLAIAARKRFVVESYSDRAVGELGKSESGAMAMTQVTLRPVISFAGENQPDAQAITAMHDAAHKHCFIANSVTTRVSVEPA
jgi:organic hydroperoxide reductase OsmC/OhrA